MFTPPSPLLGGSMQRLLPTVRQQPAPKFLANFSSKPYDARPKVQAEIQLLEPPTSCNLDDNGDPVCEAGSTSTVCGRGFRRCSNFDACYAVGADCIMQEGQVHCEADDSDPPPSTSSSTSGTIGTPNPTRTPEPGSTVVTHTIAASMPTQAPPGGVDLITQCQPCGYRPCRFSSNLRTGSPTNNTYDIFVGSVVVNCKGNTTVSVRVGGILSIGSSCVGSNIGVHLGSALDLGASYQYGQTKTVEVSQSFEIQVQPGQMGGMVASIAYESIKGSMQVAGYDIFALILNTPGQATFSPQVISCDDQFSADAPSTATCSVANQGRRSLEYVQASGLEKRVLV
ncbi:hypothetical protein CPB83DRAFT_909999 [Crepidotus variabilis]|uniref:Uncharacterized protein n=1 Tax=Crepidotus variabilis TaxID=179855 RepID=A0A9P6JL12_9AGAR|nr:hypothetical protein CPB83DRAFT_909999 [Crepidotus variabilis]